MKILLSVLVLFMSVNFVLADNLFGEVNPFPTQNFSPELNNIYEAKPAVIQQEVKTAKKAGWWKRAKNNETPEIQVPQANEGIIKDTGFVVIPSNK